MTASEREALVELVRAEAFIAPSGTEFVRRTSMGDKQILRTDDLRALVTEVERLREDAARLDWLEDHGGFMTPDGADGMSMARWGRNRHIDLRAAIDAARTTGGRDA